MNKNVDVNLSSACEASCLGVSRPTCRMEMEEDSLDPQDVDRARTFWADVDVDRVFTGVYEYLDSLKRVLKKNTATEKEYVQGLKLLECLNCFPQTSTKESPVVQVVIGSVFSCPGELLSADFSPHSTSSLPLLPSNGPSSSAAPSEGREELLPSLTSTQLQYQVHSCCRACLSSLPSMPQSMPPFWGQNPLKIPLLCGFKRLTALPLMASRGVGTSDDERVEPIVSEDMKDWDVVYKAPCGQSLRNYDDVIRFLLATESYSILQVDFFTFNSSVRLDPPSLGGPRKPELDLSRGVEPTPVELCVGDGGARPAEFRYRKDRWPHGCFLSRGPTLFSTCCDCSDGCSNAKRCACVAMIRRGHHYSHHRLDEPVPSGVYECGPWCGCDRARCLNRLVQRGIKVRLQVFQTEGRGWGVRCRDDLDRGTFVCIYAGIILRRAQTPTQPPSPKQTRTDLPSDDEVEVVTEWLVPQVLEGPSDLLESTLPPLHVPVIQRPTDSMTMAAVAQDRDKTVLSGAHEPWSPLAAGSCDQPPAQEKTDAITKTYPKGVLVHGVNGTETKSKKNFKRAMKDIYVLDASKEGNVSRFINHSCRPNLFIQNVFTDSHDPSFPVIAFFTNRVVKAGTELTWNYSADPQRKQEVSCLCGSNSCQGQFFIENLCDVYEGESES